MYMKYLMYDVTKHIIKVVNMCLLYTWWYGFWNLNSLLGILPRPTTIAFSEIKNVKMIHLLAFLILILYKNTQKSNYNIGKKVSSWKNHPRTRQIWGWFSKCDNFQCYHLVQSAFIIFFLMLIQYIVYVIIYKVL